MPSPSDPIRSWNRRLQRTWIAAAALTALLAVWALKPIRTEQKPNSHLSSEPFQPASSPDISDDQAINRTVFAAAIWNPLPAPPPIQQAAVPNPPPAKLLDLQLVGIINEEGVFKAAVYDADADRLLILASGDRIRDQTVKSITAMEIELSDGRSLRKLSLKTEAAGS